MLTSDKPEARLLEPGQALPRPFAHLLLQRFLGRSAFARTYLLRFLDRPDSYQREGTSWVVEFYEDGPAVPRGGSELGPGRSVLNLRHAAGWPAVAIVTALPIALPSPYCRTRMLRPIGWGGQGEVWRASSDDFPGVELAIKVHSRVWYRPDLSSRQACLEEATHGLRVHSSYIARTFQGLSLAEGGDWPSVMTVMAYHRAALTDIVQELRDAEQTLPSGVAIAWARQLLVGLRDLHETYGLVHRDIKPDNVLLRLKQNAHFSGRESLIGSRAMLSDLGVAWPVGTVPTQLLYADNWKNPNENYLDAARPVQVRDDLYSLGRVLEYLTRKKVVVEPEKGRLEKASIELMQGKHSAREVRSSLRDAESDTPSNS